ncbi:hypothetical protein M569_14637, partial [Genlisea aurea]
GGENSEIEFMDIAVPGSFDGSVVFRVVIDVVGFILFMHQQIPSVIEGMTQEFAELQSEYADLEAELTSSETKSLSRKRNQASRKRYGTSASGDLTRSSKLAESTSRKAIRALISNGAGSDSCPGPTKLFLFVKAPSCFSSPLNFLPKRELRYNKKIMPLRLRFLCRGSDDAEISGRDLIWYECRHIIKGISFQTIPPED